MDPEILAWAGRLFADFKRFERSLNPQQKWQLGRLLHEMQVIIMKMIAACDLQPEIKEEEIRRGDVDKCRSG